MATKTTTRTAVKKPPAKATVTSASIIQTAKPAKAPAKKAAATKTAPTKNTAATKTAATKAVVQKQVVKKAVRRTVVKSTAAGVESGAPAKKAAFRKAPGHSSDRAEQAVRRYMDYLSDPATLVNAGEVAQLETAAAAASDPLDRLLALGALRKAKTGDVEAIERDFVRFAERFAAKAGLARQDFAGAGVSASVLDRAFGPASATKAAKAAKAPVGRPAKKAKVTKAAGGGALRGAGVVRAAAERLGEFRLSDIEGASMGTVRKVIDEMLADGSLVMVGVDSNWQARGRAPYLYRVS